MHYSKLTLLLPAFGLLSACGGGGGILGGDPFAVTESLAANSDDTMTASIDRGDGVSGVISLAQVGATGSSAALGAFRVDVSGDGNTATVIAGGRNYTLPLLAKGPTVRRFGSESGTLLQMNEAGTNQLATLSSSGGLTGLSGFGYLGIETPIDLLPAGDVAYSGLWGGQAYSDDLFSSGVVSGSMATTVNFNEGTLTGTFDGTLDADVFSGTISGATSGNGIHGTMNVVTGATGSIAMAGNAYGYDGVDLNGAVAGNLNDGSNSYAVGGTFTMDID